MSPESPAATDPRSLCVELSRSGVEQPCAIGSGVLKRFPGQNSWVSLSLSPLTSVSCLLGVRTLQEVQSMPTSTCVPSVPAVSVGLF